MKNLQNTPSIILESKSIGHPIDFKWNKKKINQFLDPLERNTELENALLQINHKASMGLTAALLEWVNWRFKGYTKMNEETQKRIEAIWCSIDNVKNTRPLTFDDNFDIPAAGHINGALWIALMNVRMIDVMYRKGSYFLQSELVGLVLLVRHITPKKRVFDKWLRTIIMELIHQYPSQYYNANLDETDEAIYDSSDEPVICRNFFFDPEFQHSTQASEKAINDLIHNLDTKSNQFCVSQKKHHNQGI